VVVDALDASPAERQILRAAAIRRNGAGALPALRTVLRAMESAAARYPSARADAWLVIARGLVERIAALAAAHQWLSYTHHAGASVSAGSEPLPLLEPALSPAQVAELMREGMRWSEDDAFACAGLGP
jgi:hypothetical protein